MAPNSKSALFKKLLICYSLFLYIEGAHMAEEHVQDRSSVFGQKLYDELLVEKPDENIIFSPFSIETAIAMSRIGAQGKTAEEMDKALGFTTSKDVTEIANEYNANLKSINEVPYINIANRIYVMSGFKIEKPFNEILTKQFYSDAKEVNFAQSNDAANEINNWVESKTNNRIQNFISPELLTSDTRLVVINAIHFKAKWEHKFAEQLTKDKHFYLNENDHVTVPMMHVASDFLYGEIPELDAKAIKLPYTTDSGCSMFILLPNSRTGLNDMVKKMDDVSYHTILSKMSSEGVRVELPKFKAEFSIELNEPLKRLGMTSMFSDEADFSNMLESDKSLPITKVLHKAFIEVNEEGTEASAATGNIHTSRMGKIYKYEFTADKPFIYFITHSSHKVIFAGKINKF